MGKGKKSREQVYSDILESRHGIRIQDCAVVGFKCKSEMHMFCFHFRFMEEGIEHYIFDGMGDSAVIILPNKPELLKAIDRVAFISDAVKYVPNLKNVFV